MVSHFKLAATKQHIARRLGKQGSRASVWTKIDETFEGDEANEIPFSFVSSTFQRRTIVTILNVKFQLSTPFPPSSLLLLSLQFIDNIYGIRSKESRFHRRRNEKEHVRSKEK